MQTIITKLKSSTKSFAATFKSKKFQKSFLTDLLTIALLIGILLLYNTLLSSNMETFVNIYEHNPIDSIIYSEDTHQIDQLTSNLQGLFIKSVGLTILLFVSLLSIYGYSRKLQWDKLTNKQNKNWKKWTIFTIVQVIALTIITLVLTLIKGLIIWIIQTVLNLHLESIAFNIIDQLLLVAILFTLIHIIIISNYTFHKEYLVWKTIGDTYHNIKVTIKQAKHTIVAALIYLLLNAAILGILYNLITKNQILNITIQAIIFAIAISYLRYSWYQDSKKQLSHHK